MERFIAFVDILSTWVGKAFAWCIMVLTLGTTYEVVARYVFRAPTSWAFDMSYIMYGSLFMMAGAYALSRDAHVRGDVIYRLWKPRTQAWMELLLYFLFFFPGMLALIYAGIDYAQESWSYMPYGPNGPRGEISINSPAGVPVSPVKTMLPIAAFFCLLQGVAEVCRCIICIRTGIWPERAKDVEETEVALVESLRKREAELSGSMRREQSSAGEQEQERGESST